MATTYEPIATSTFNSTFSTVTFSGIPSTYTDLRLTVTGTVVTNDVLRARVNGDSGTNYSYTLMYGNGTSAIADTNTARSLITMGAGGMQTSNTTFFTLDIFSYAGSTYKTMLGTASGDFNGSGTTTVAVNLWRSTSAINSITVFTNGGNNFSSGTATLYGIKAA